MTKFLLEKGIDVNTRLVLSRDWAPPGIGMDVTMTPLHAALTDGRVETARLLIAHSADVHARDSIGRSPLIVAITYCPSAIELLLNSGVDINEQTRFGAPLLAAARYQWLYTGDKGIQDRENAVKILLEKGADPNTHDSDGRNALMVMSMEHRSDSRLVRDIQALALRTTFMLREHRSNGIEFGIVPRIMPPPPPKPGPLDLEARAQPDLALQLIGKALLQAKCDINAADSNGRTPLMYAARYNQPTAVRLLLEHGANVKALDKSGMTALNLAKQFDNQAVIGLLQSASVQPGAAKKSQAVAQ